MIKKLIYALWGLLAAGLLALVLMFYSITKGWIGFVPPVEELENPNYKFATQIISSDGKLLSTYSYSRENRVWTNYDDLSRALIDALISTEDVRFSKHSGIDLRALMRAIVKTGLLTQSSSGGGSTLTQQLAKQLYT
jgi:penicillin-binding protein 1A